MGQLNFENLQTDFLLEFASSAVVLVIGWLAVLTTRRFFAPKEVRLVQLAFVAHALGAFAQVTITREFYGSGDIMVYWIEGIALADVLRYDFVEFAPRLLTTFLHEQPDLPFTLYGTGATASQSVVSGVLQFITGDSLFGSSLLLSMMSLLGKVGLYSAIKPELAEDKQLTVGAAILLLPSTVYWCGSLSKEAVAIAFFGTLVWALRKIAARERLLLMVPLALISLVVVAMIKAYILLALSFAGGVWVFWTAKRKKSAPLVVKPVYLVLGALLSLGGLSVVARINPEYGSEQIQERASKQHMHGAEAGGDSYYELGGAADEERPLSQQLLLAPAGLFTALFRPLVFEARSAMVLANSVESTTLFILLLVSLFWLGLGRAWSIIVESPAMMFCLVFTASFGSAVGVLTTNLGTLSRYRAPMMPFFAVLVAVLWLEAKKARLARITANAAPVQARRSGMTSAPVSGR